MGICIQLNTNTRALSRPVTASLRTVNRLDVFSMNTTPLLFALRREFPVDRAAAFAYPQL